MGNEIRCPICGYDRYSEKPIFAKESRESNLKVIGSQKVCNRCNALFGTIAEVKEEESVGPR